MSLEEMRNFFGYYDMKNSNSQSNLNQQPRNVNFDSNDTHDFNIWEKFPNCEQTINTIQNQGNCHAAWAVSYKTCTFYFFRLDLCRLFNY
jgi:hypothetical protein